MIDLARLMDEAMTAIERVDPADFPHLVGNRDVGGNRQAIDIKSISHLSHFSHQADVASADKNPTNPGERACAGGRARDEISSGEVGNVGTVGNASRINDFHFPLSILEVGKVGNAAPAGSYPSDIHSTPVATIPRQTDIFRCFICSMHETAEKPLLPVLSEIRGEHHWLHSACWPEHVRRCAEARTAFAGNRKRVAS